VPAPASGSRSSSATVRSPTSPSRSPAPEPADVPEEEATSVADAEDEAADAPDEAVDDTPTRHGAPVTTSLGQEVLHPSRDELVGIVRTLRDDDGYLMCLDVCGVDYLTYEADRGLPSSVAPERFEVVVTLISHARRDRLRLRVQVP